jgi:hypothetical protein
MVRMNKNDMSDCRPISSLSNYRPISSLTKYRPISSLINYISTITEYKTTVSSQEAIREQ